MRCFRLPATSTPFAQAFLLHGLPVEIAIDKNVTEPSKFNEGGVHVLENVLVYSQV